MGQTVTTPQLEGHRRRRDWTSVEGSERDNRGENEACDGRKELRTWEMEDAQWHTSQAKLLEDG